MNTLSIVGTRPEIIRLCAWEKEVLFTGQHIDWSMGERFLESSHVELNHVYRLPDSIGREDLDTLIEGVQSRIFRILNDPGVKPPEIIIVHGDTRSAFAGAIAAHNLKVLLAHTEAGVRCFLDTIEERYRKQIDKLSNYNFCPIPLAVENLKKEGIAEGVYFTGDLVYDQFLRERECSDFVFVTLHRFENIENKAKLTLLIDSLKEYKLVIFPLHPHTRDCMERFGIEMPKNVLVLEPQDHKKTLQYIKDAKLVLTDSGGIQREAYWSGTPCKLAREATEWGYYTGAFGDGKAGEKIKHILETKQPWRKFDA